MYGKLFEIKTPFTAKYTQAHANEENEVNFRNLHTLRFVLGKMVNDVGKSVKSWNKW